MATALALVEQTAEFTPGDAERLGAEITELCSYIYAAESRLLALIREFDEKEYWAEQGLCSCAHWLNFKCGIGMNAAREKVRVAHALAQLPKISAGFAKGALSYSKVRAITRIADETNEDYLLMIATHGTAHHVEKLVSKYRMAKRLQDAEIANEQYNSREVTHYYDHDGCLVIKESSGSTADRYQVIVHVTAETSNIEDGPDVCPKGTWTAETSRRIACDSSIVVIKEDENGEPLSIGRRSRTIPPAMRRALRVRDKGCRFPGCTNTRFVDGHHIKHWANGGETSLKNLVMLCRHHHHLVHEGGFVCERSADGEIRFKDRRAHALESSAAMTGIAANDDIQKWFDREFLEAGIDSETCTAKWYAGEWIDWNVAVGNLF